VLRAAEGVIFIPVASPLVGDLIEFVKKMWVE
jgi:hypothetical protein